MSLRLRFTLLVTGLLAAVLIGMGVWIATNERTLAEDRIERRMDRVVRDSARYLDVPGNPDADPGARIEGLPDGVRAQVDYYLPGPTWRRVQSMHTGEPVSTPEKSGGGRARGTALDVVTIDGRAYYARDFEAPQRRPRRLRPGRRGPGGRRPDSPEAEGRRIVGWVYVDQASMLDAEGYGDAIQTLWIAGVGALVVGALLAWFVSGAMVGPVRRAARAAESIDRLSQRLPEGRSQDELGRLVRVLNVMLARLEAGSQREREFLATASHEMRRPLAALVAELELAQRGERSKADLEQAIGLALSDARNLSRLVDDLLSHARARAGGLVLAEGPVDLVDLVAERVDRCQRIVGDGAKIEVGELPEVVVVADADALGRVVENLVMNAATHGGEGVRVRVDATNGDGLEIHVEDDGPGIPAHEQARIFESFGRGDNARSASGAGLGLAIVRDLVEAHGGTVRVESPLHENGGGRGTRFTVSLPAERVTSR